MVPNPLLGQSRPFVQGGAEECPVYCRGSAQWVNRARCSQVGRSNVLSWFWHMLSMGPMGERVKGLPAGRWEADILCRSSAITQGLVQLDLQQKTDHLMGPGQKPSPETAGVGWSKGREGALFKRKIKYGHRVTGRGHCRNGQVPQVGFPRKQILRNSACRRFI